MHTLEYRSSPAVIDGAMTPRDKRIRIPPVGDRAAVSYLTTAAMLGNRGSAPVGAGLLLTYDHGLVVPTLPTASAVSFPTKSQADTDAIHTIWPMSWQPAMPHIWG